LVIARLAEASALALRDGQLLMPDKMISLFDEKLSQHRS
jgi:hypothetical protein